jgi:hypothetical protein
MQTVSECRSMSGSPRSKTSEPGTSPASSAHALLVFQGASHSLSFAPSKPMANMKWSTVTAKLQYCTIDRISTDPRALIGHWLTLPFFTHSISRISLSLTGISNVRSRHPRLSNAVCRSVCLLCLLCLLCLHLGNLLGFGKSTITCLLRSRTTKFVILQYMRHRIDLFLLPRYDLLIPSTKKNKTQ